jgi:hypothetical protein
MEKNSHHSLGKFISKLSEKNKCCIGENSESRFGKKLVGCCLGKIVDMLSEQYLLR